MRTLEEIKDQLANEHYSTPFWFCLSEVKKAMLVDLVAIEYAKEQINQLQKSLSI